MTEIQLNTWEELNSRINDMRRAIEGEISSDLIFRGQSNYEWPLQSTLDRVVKSNRMLISDYHSLLMDIKDEIENFTKMELNLNRSINITDSFDFSPKELAFMAYLRHHYFPSPLVDWSSSLDVASFFAFSDIYKNANNIAIFVFIDVKERGIKVHWEKEMHIELIDRQLDENKRHSRQKSKYTLCMQKIDGKLYYVKHDDFNYKFRENQDCLTKYTLPISERKKVLSHLKSKGIDEYYLFNTEDSKVKSLALQKLIESQSLTF